MVHLVNAFMDALNFCIKEIAYDNGAVFRGQTEQEVLDRVWRALADSTCEFSIDDLNIVEDALRQMTDDELRNISTDSPEHAEAIVRKYNIPTDVHMLIDGVLDFAFENL